MASTTNGLDGDNDLPEINLNLNKKTYRHVQPRIDPLSYQTEIEDEVLSEVDPIVGGKLSSIFVVTEITLPDSIGGKATTNWYNSTKKINSTAEKHQRAISEFLLITRNIFENVRVTNKNHWTSEDVNIPLESDEFAIDYLASHDYNVDSAWLQLSISLGCGKGKIDCLLAEYRLTLMDRLCPYSCHQCYCRKVFWACSFC